MKKITVINDLSGLGKCSLTAAISVISAMGVQAVPLPTAILSNQTGYASYFLDDYTDRMDRIIEEWEKIKFVPDGIYTGFLAGEAQADKILDFFRRFRRENTLVLVDPIMGDQGAAYGIYSDGLCDRMRQLCRQAQVITPNLTEALLLLYGKEELEMRYAEVFRCRDEVLEKTGQIAKKLCEVFGVQAAVITGIDSFDENGMPLIGNTVYQNGHSSHYFAEKSGGSYSGTGDLFASILSAGLVKGISMETCVKKATDFLSKAIRDTKNEGTDRNEGVCFEPYLHELWELVE